MSAFARWSKPPGASKTSAFSRDHTIHIDNSGLMTIVGGKWTTYRHMAEDAWTTPLRWANCPTCPRNAKPENPWLQTGSRVPERSGVYGSDAEAILALAAADQASAATASSLPYIAAEVIWAVRDEMARNVDDVLCRRTRALFLNAAAIEMAPAVAKLMAHQMEKG